MSSSLSFFSNSLCNLRGKKSLFPLWVSFIIWENKKLNQVALEKIFNSKILWLYFVNHWKLMANKFNPDWNWRSVYLLLHFLNIKCKPGNRDMNEWAPLCLSIIIFSSDSISHAWYYGAFLCCFVLFVFFSKKNEILFLKLLNTVN